MLIYQKGKKLYGTLDSIPHKADDELTYRDEQGKPIEPIPGDTYMDNGKGGIKRQSDGKTVNVYIEDYRAIPGGMPVPRTPKFTKVSDYLYEITVDTLDYAYANQFFHDMIDTGYMPGQCTSV